jgi:hypothetical protein
MGDSKRCIMMVMIRKETIVMLKLHLKIIKMKVFILEMNVDRY